MSADQKLEFIKSTLSNDEYSSDSELVELFSRECHMSIEEAQGWVDQRSTYLNNIVMDDGSRFDPKERMFL